VDRQTYVLEARGIDKSFASVKVLSDVELHLKPGEVHALMGENGAGKSTLMKIIMGIYKSDAGEILFEGRPASIRKTSDALKLGIAMIHQELSPIPEMTVAENIFIGRETESRFAPFVNRKELNRRTQALLEAYNMAGYIHPGTPMKRLSIAQTQMIEIIKAVSYQSKVIIMDEPTSSLSEKETTELFRIIGLLKAQQVGVIYITHRMEEVFTLADRVSVFRDGKFIACKEVRDTGREELISMMVGRELSSGYPQNTAPKGDVVLEVRNFSRKGVFENVSFQVRAGEILGLAGLVGAGRSEVVRALVGYDRLEQGQIFLEGKEITVSHPKDALRHNIIMAPEDRKELGLVLCRSIRENITLQNMAKLAGKLFMKLGREKQACGEIASLVTIKMNSINDQAGRLSGGNQQKVVLAKSMLSGPKVLIMDEPTRGIDVGAKAEIYKIMVELAQKGMAIIMISSEMPELLGMSDRVVVMSAGRITGELTDMTEHAQQDILKLALGGI